MPSSSDVAASHIVLVATAKSEGSWGNQLRIDVDHDTANPDSLFNLTVTKLVEQNGALVAARVETHRNLSMSSFSPTYVESVVSPRCSSPEPGARSAADAEGVGWGSCGTKLPSMTTLCHMTLNWGGHHRRDRPRNRRTLRVGPLAACSTLR